MNIIVKPKGSDLCYCRPDTTWERESKDFYVPDYIKEMYWAPVVFVRISKAGKCINPKFVSRYYDSYNFGTLLYGQPAEGMLGLEDLKEEHRELLEDAICKASMLISVRIGDYVAVELDEIRQLDPNAAKEFMVIF